jgi:hypothetical protein
VRAADGQEFWYMPAALRRCVKSVGMRMPDFAIGASVALNVTGLNRQGHAIRPGSDGKKYYCGRKKEECSSSAGGDGYCGPTNGPQCASCKEGVVEFAPSDSELPWNTHPVLCLMQCVVMR